MAITSIASFWVVSMLFVLTPGADWAYAISSGLRNRSVVPAISGMLSGHLAATIVVAAGLGLLLTGDPVILAVLTVIGALYIGWMGIGMMRAPDSGALADGGAPSNGGALAAGGPVVEPHAEVDRVSTGGQFARGMGVSLLNPKVILLLGALLPPFAKPDAALPIPAQLMVLGSVHLVCTAVVYFAVGLLAAKFLGGHPAAAVLVTRLSGAVLTVIAVVLMVHEVAAWR